MRALAIALLAAGCASPAVLGGPTPDTTSHPCMEGSAQASCPNGYDCPPPFVQGGRCEWALPPYRPNPYGERQRDAGR